MTEYERAAQNRLLDRPQCDWPEIGLIGYDVIRLAAALRRAGIATATYPGVPVRRQAKRATADDVDYLLFAGSLRMCCRVTGDEWQLSDPVKGAMFAVVCGYIPNRAYIDGLFS